jgi:hypothetical protein
MAMHVFLSFSTATYPCGRSHMRLLVFVSEPQSAAVCHFA